MRLRVIALGVFNVLLANQSIGAEQAVDTYRTSETVSAFPATPPLRDASCRALPDTRPIELDDAILQAICSHPLARQAWASARASSASLRFAEAAYLPKLTAAADFRLESTSIPDDFGGRRSVSESAQESRASRAINMSWVLFDFGKRGAARRQAEAFLAAANAVQDATLQTVLYNAAGAFYAVRDAQASADAARSAEAIAHDSLVQATAKRMSGVGTRSDELQARTSYRRAVLDRVEAEGSHLSATGALAVALGFDANTNLQFKTDDGDSEVEYFAVVDDKIDQLIEDAKQLQPKLVAARANLDASRADIEIARSQGQPTISLLGSITQSDRLLRRQQSVGPASDRSSMIGIQVTIPLFEGFASRHRVNRARALADQQEAALRDTELQVSLDVWNSYHAARTFSTNLENARYLLDDAQHALAIARGRYAEGVGTFTELLAAQTALADAQKQRVLAVSNWRKARLRLAASLGRLGLWTGMNY